MQGYIGNKVQETTSLPTLAFSPAAAQPIGSSSCTPVCWGMTLIVFFSAVIVSLAFILKWKSAHRPSCCASCCCPCNNYWLIFLSFSLLPLTVKQQWKSFTEVETLKWTGILTPTWFLRRASYNVRIINLLKFDWKGKDYGDQFSCIRTKNRYGL